MDNASTRKTPAIHRWLVAHPRFTVHFTPTGLPHDQVTAWDVRGPSLALYLCDVGGDPYPAARFQRESAPCPCWRRS